MVLLEIILINQMPYSKCHGLSEMRKRNGHPSKSILVLEVRGLFLQFMRQGEVDLPEMRWQDICG